MENEWVWQGFFGPMPAAAEAWGAVEIGAAVGVLVPETAPMAVDKGAALGMFAVQTRASAPMATPEGMSEAETTLVGRLLGR